MQLSGGKFDHVRVTGSSAAPLTYTILCVASLTLFCVLPHSLTLLCVLLARPHVLVVGKGVGRSPQQPRAGTGKKTRWLLGSDIMKIPEFFYLPELLVNVNNVNFGSSVHSGPIVRA